MQPKPPHKTTHFALYLVVGMTVLVLGLWTMHEQAPIHWFKEALVFENDPLDYDIFIAADISGGLYLLYKAFRLFVG
jgi:hypothetical protein